MIITQVVFPRLRQELAGKTIAYTCGTFDLLHVGHIEFLEWCSQQADILITSLHSDAMVRANKGMSRPIIPEAHRLRMINALRMVDYAFIVDSDDSKSSPWITVARELHPNVCILGPDWADLEIDLWKQILPDAEIRVTPPRIGPSTSQIIEDIIKTAQEDKK